MSAGNIRNWLLGLSRRQKLAVVLFADIFALPWCLIVSYYLRLGEGDLVHQYGISAPIITALITIPVFHACGLYDNVLRFIDIRLLRSAGLGLAILCISTYGLSLLLHKHLPPRGSLLIYWFIAFAYIVTSRFGARQLLRPPSTHSRKQVRAAIYGAGESGFQLANALRVSRICQPMFFIDDDPHLHQKRVAGLPVLAPQELSKSVAKFGIEKLILAMPSASPERRHQILDTLEPLGLAIQTLPTLEELIDGKVSAHSVRDVHVDDLLGRKAVPPHEHLFARCVAGKTVLVTGAGGSIGSELCRQIVTQKPSHLILLDHSEYALYTIEQELRERTAGITLTAILASVQDASRIRTLLERHGVHTIYHAAAYKHVPLVEANAAEGVHNNVEGTLTIGLAAGRHRVETCVLISTDKAVRPTNVMGASKRVSELIFQALARHPDYQATTFSMVRFGNVLGSSGSVVPLFRRQIAAGGPITLTHPDIVRYFMLIPEAAQLVIQAGAMARGGDVFVLDMGAPIRVIELARTMIRLSGLAERSADNPDGEIEIKITGLRPGEKLYEELLIGTESVPSAHPRILSSNESMLPWGQLLPLLDALRTACKIRDAHLVRAALQAVVPEYTPSAAPAPSLPLASMENPRKPLATHQPTPIAAPS